MTMSADYLKQIQRGIDFIEGHLTEDLDLCSVSRSAGMSHWHFQRIFKAITNETLKTYVRARRLAHARIALVSTDKGILQIAQEAGFEAQASFTRAFKSAFDVAPGHYRRFGDKHLFLEKLRIDEHYLRHVNTNVSLTPELEHTSNRRLIGLPTHFYSVDSERNNIGAKLPPLWVNFLARLVEVEDRVPGVCYGVVRQAQPDDEVLEYTSAVEVSADSQAPLPPGMVEVEVPAACYAFFTHLGDPKEIDRTVSYAYGTWLSQSRRRHTYGPDLEIYDHRYSQDGPRESVMTYGIPVL